jgi:hypothetical protein
MITKLRRILGFPDPNYPGPPLEEGERIILEGRAGFSATLLGGRGGRLVLTNRRVYWYETRDVPWPFKRIVGQVNLSDIASVDKGTLLSFVFGGRPLRLRLGNGKTKCLHVYRLNEWVTAIRGVIDKDTDSP